MANISRPFGFRPSRYYSDAPFNGQAQLYAFAAAQANVAYIGDLVTFDATNRSTPLTDPVIPGSACVAPVVAALTTASLRGVIAGFVAEPEFTQSATASLGLRYRLASTYRYVWVVDDVNVVFEAEENGNSYTSQTNNAVGKAGDILYAAGNNISGISGIKLNTFQTAAVRPFRAVKYSNRPDNFNFNSSDTNTFAHVDVIINNSDLLGTKSSIGL